MFHAVRLRSAALAAGLIAASCGSAFAWQAAAEKVQRKPFQVDVTLTGVFEAQDMTGVVLRPLAWSELSVVSAVPQGTQVHAGDRLVELDTRKIDDAIRDLESSQNLADLAIQQAEDELAVLEKSTPLDLAAAERTKLEADEDLKLFLEVNRGLLEKSAHYSLQSAQANLENQAEELKQLEKMYAADDLTEETEEIVLKRQREAVDQAKFYLERAKVDYDQSLKYDLTRQEIKLKDGAVQQALSLEKSRSTLPAALAQKRLGLEKLKRDREQSLEQLGKLRQDRTAMPVVSPADGIVYYGECVQGAWPKSAAVAERMRQGGLLLANEVFITIVKPRPIFVRAAVAESDLHRLREGLAGKATPTGYPSLRLPVKFQQLSPVAMAPGSYWATFSAEPPAESPIMPGMTCGLKLIAYRNEAALAVSSKAVFDDEQDDSQHYVYVVGADGKPERRTVTVGQKSADKTEITAGLNEGDQVLPERPAS